MASFKTNHPLHRVMAALFVILSVAGGVFLYLRQENYRSQLSATTQQKSELQTQFDSINTELSELKNQSQIKINADLRNQIAEIQKSYDQAVKVYEDLLSFRDRGGKAAPFEASLAKALTQLSAKNYTEANKTLTQLTKDLSAANQKLIATFVIPTNVPVNNAPPSSGYSQQQVSTDVGNFLVKMIAADLSNTRVIVDTASDSTCADNCPVMNLGAYVARNGAFAGVNGSYFCPASYPSCAGKTNSFDLLLMNVRKTYFNSDNNVYSSNPGVVFGNGYIRFLSSVSEWGRDTGIDGMISNYPLLVFNKNNMFGGNSDPKQSSKGNRSFVSNQGNRVFIGVVYNVSVADMAKVMVSLGMDNALNLDNGGSTALWSGGYKAGPGRDLPNVILFVSK